MNIPIGQTTLTRKKNINDALKEAGVTQTEPSNKGKFTELTNLLKILQVGELTYTEDQTARSSISKITSRLGIRVQTRLINGKLYIFRSK
jgi:hypothetical protein